MAKIVYVCGEGRSGSTLLGSVLSGVEGCMSIGEVQYLWNLDNPAGQRCGCLRSFHECPIWQRVFAELDLTDEVRRQEGLRQRAEEMRLRRLPRRHWEWARYRRRPEHAARLAAVYSAFSAATESDVIVDVTKFPSDALAALLAPGHETFILHLVRDPRATAFSRQRSKTHGTWEGARAMRKVTILRNAWRWVTFNMLTELFVRSVAKSQHYRRLRYEDFARAPVQSTQALLEWIGVGDRAHPVAEDGSFEQPRSHSLMGNPDRFKTGRVAIRLDEQWRHATRRRENALTTLLTLPLLRRYGYSLF